MGFGLPELTLYKEKPLMELDPIGAKKFPVLYEMRQECHTGMLMDQIISGKPIRFKGLVMTAANPGTYKRELGEGAQGAVEPRAARG